MFSGHEGHKATVITTSFHSSGNKFVSAGMDHCIKLWTLPSDTHMIQSSDIDLNKIDKTAHVQLPLFSTQKVHTDYIDCVQFITDECILSKSVNNSLVLWKPIINETKKRKAGDIIPLREISINHCQVWFLRFQTDHMDRLLALGDSIGNVNIWYLDPNDDKRGDKYNGTPLFTLRHSLCSSVVRMVSFSPDGKSLVYCCDDATVWKYDAVF